MLSIWRGYPDKAERPFQIIRSVVILLHDTMADRAIMSILRSPK
jgi:hypothetical protein